MSYTYTAYLSINDTDGRSKNFTETPTVTVWDGRTADEIESPSPTLTNITVGLYAVEITLDDITDVLFKIVPHEDDEEAIADIKVIHEGYIETVGEKLDAILDDTGTSGVKLDPVQGAITWGQQKIIANVAGAGALDIENTSTGGLGGVGIRAEGEFAGQYNAASQTRTSAGQFNAGSFGVWNLGDSTGQKNDGGSQAVAGFDPNIMGDVISLRNALMKYVISGAGTVVVNGAYYPTSDYQFANADFSILIERNGSVWKIYSPAPDGYPDDIFYTATNSAMTPDKIYNWQVGAQGTAPTPTINLIYLLDEIKGAGWTNETLKAIMEAIGDIDGGGGGLDAEGVRDAIGLAAANLDTQLSGIHSKTTNLPASPAATGDAMTLTAAYDNAKDDVLTPLATVDTVVDGIATTLANPDNFKADVSALAKATDLQDVENKVDLIDVTTVANGGKIDAVDTKVSAIDTDTIMSFMIDGFTFEQIVQIMASVLAGKLTRSGDTLTFRDLADTVNRVVAETDENKQRTGITYTV